MERECDRCFYYGKPSDAYEDAQDDCMYQPTVEDDNLAPPCMRDENIEDVILEPACIDEKTSDAEAIYISRIHRDMVENNKSVYTCKFDFHNGDRIKITVEKVDE